MNYRSIRFRAFWLILIVVTAAARTPTAAGVLVPKRLAPTHKDVAYGKHERHVLDFWQAESKTPAPLVIYIHGGGFHSGGKKGIDRRIVRRLLDANISVVALTYRLLKHAPLPVAHDDCRQAVQFLRGKAQAWNIDKSRIGAYGNSAGAQLCMYLAFHDDMAKPRTTRPSG